MGEGPVRVLCHVFNQGLDNGLRIRRRRRTSFFLQDGDGCNVKETFCRVFYG